MLVALRPSLRLLHEKFSLPAPKHALLSNIFNDELSDPRNITDRITRIAKRKLLLMTFSAMIEKVSQVSQLVDNWCSRVLTAGCRSHLKVQHVASMRCDVVANLTHTKRGRQLDKGSKP